jgi:hypothetical protein
MAITVGDVRSRINSPSLDGGRRLAAATEGSSFAPVVPLRPISATGPSHDPSPEQLSQIDRAFFGPFFREKYGTAGDRGLENHRIRYYGPVHPANNAGELAGRRYVHEFNTLTGCTRGWHEILDRMGNVRQIRAERGDGIARYYQFDGDGRYRGSW